MIYPVDDFQYEETKIVKVNMQDDGWELEREDGFSFYVKKRDFLPNPEPGMTARFYGKGIGQRVRGLFLNGKCVFYRTEEEDQELLEIELYGKDAQDWLDRWDNNKSVFSIAMGGLGPGYEQAIQITTAEVLRTMLQGNGQLNWGNEEELKKYWRELDKKLLKNKVISSMGLSGAQMGAAKNLACFLYRHGPRKVMKDERVKDRHIQVSKNFPTV